MLRITRTACNFMREPFIQPFGFKGGYVDEIWQVVVRLESENGVLATGLGVQSILWSGPEVFARFSPTAGNNLMYLMTEYALELARGMPFENPVQLLEQLLPSVYEYGRRLTGVDTLGLTFALNALVPLDNAAWILYARENGITSFDEMIPSEYRTALSARHPMLAAVPLITYGVSAQAVSEMVGQGSFFFKIKIGSDPERDGDLEKMVEWDKRRLGELHALLKDRRTPYTDSGEIPYYLDANGRYDSKQRLNKLLDYADSIGALKRILLLEEPFSLHAGIDVHDLPVRIAADESAHSDRDLEELAALGYRAVALKPIAKTLSMSLKILKAAARWGMPCFCADLTVSPVMVDWNKNFAARLPALPGMKIGVLESNGSQNYRNWEALVKAHPCYPADWIEANNGLFATGERFFAESGGIFRDCPFYDAITHLR